MVTREQVLEELHSPMGGLMLSSLMEVDYILKNAKRRYINATSYSLSIMPQMEFFNEVNLDVPIPKIETYVQLISKRTLLGEKFDGTAAMLYSDSPYDIAESIVYKFIDKNKALLQRDIAYRSSGSLARIMNTKIAIPATIEILEDETFYQVDSTDFIVDGEEISLVAVDSSTPYAKGFIRVIIPQSNIVGIVSNRRASEGDTILTGSKVGFGVCGVRELFLGDRVFNQLRTNSTTPVRLQKSIYEDFDDILTDMNRRIPGIYGAGKPLVYLSEQLFDKVHIKSNYLRKIEELYMTYYEFGDVVIATNPYLKNKPGQRPFAFILDMDTLELVINQSRSNSGDFNVSLLEQKDHMQMKEFYQLLVSFEYQLSCTDFKRNAVVEFVDMC